MALDEVLCLFPDHTVTGDSSEFRPKDSPQTCPVSSIEAKRSPTACHRFVANQVRLALPTSVRHWSLRCIQINLIKIEAKVIHHVRQLIFQMAEVAIPEQLFAQILARIRALAPGAGRQCSRGPNY